MLALDQIANLYGEPMALVIQCCRVHFKTDSIEQLNTRLNAIEETNRTAVLKKVQLLSRLHRIRPVVYRVLLNSVASEEFKTSLKNELHSITLQNFNIAKETERIVKKLENVGITAIPYKGVAFSQQFYGDVSMRESSDIDLVINSDQLDSIIELMQEDGYIADGLEGLKRIKREDFITQQKDFCFDFDKTYHVEFHWRITHPNFCVKSPIDLFKNIQTSELELGEHLRAITLHHWIHDGFEYLKTLLDIGQGIFSNELKLNFLEIKENSLFGFQIAERCNYELFGLGLHHTESNPNIEKKAKAIIKYNLKSNVGGKNSNTSINLVQQYYTSFKNQLAFKKTYLEKLAFIFKFWIGLLLPKHGDYSMIKIPKGFGVLYFFIRAYRQLRRVIKNATT